MMTSRTGTKAVQHAAKSGPLAKATTMPDIIVDAANIILQYFSPIASVIIEKFSPICDGSYSTFSFSKYATSCLSIACR